ncbi:MAG: hypothetical protein MUE60_15585 [Candidatus Eisenbacteria bacterium]|nr:hypothetical protein [Candidatus Eisenbacteria bacterium]
MARIPAVARFRPGGGRRALPTTGLSLAVMACLAGMAAPRGASGFCTERVIYLVIDGPRDTEFLEDTTHAHIPGIWNVLRPQGVVSHGLYNNGPTQTVPGHAMLGSGAYQNLPDDGTRRPTRPLVWEYLRDQSQAADSACVLVIAKDKLRALSYSTAHGYGAEDSAVVLGPVSSDRIVVEAFMGYAEAVQPIIAMLCLGDVDEVAHTGDWEAYLSAIERCDSLAVALWQWIERTPPFSGATALIVTADHGRHDDDWTDHGCPCHGCRHLPLIALGPDFRIGAEVTDTLADMWDVSTTMGWVLGLAMPFAEGRFLLEMLRGEGVPPEAPVVSIREEDGAVMLWWSPVTVDVEGNPETISCYRVYRGTDVAFVPDSASLIAPAVPIPIFIDRDTTVVGNPACNASYRVDVLDIWLNPSAPSNLVGEVDFSTAE